MLRSFCFCLCLYFFFFKQKTAYEMRISDWSSDVCSSDLDPLDRAGRRPAPPHPTAPSFAPLSKAPYPSPSRGEGMARPAPPPIRKRRQPCAFPQLRVKRPHHAARASSPATTYTPLGVVFVLLFA